MEEYYSIFKEIKEISKKLGERLTDLLCIHEMYYVYCEEYHTKPGLVISDDWFVKKAPSSLMSVCYLTESMSEDVFNEYFKDSVASLKVLVSSGVLDRLKNLSRITDQSRETFLDKLKELFEIRKSRMYEFGSIENEDYLLPNERMDLALRCPDPIDKIVDLQLILIQKVAHYVYHSNSFVKLEDDLRVIFETNDQYDFFIEMLHGVEVMMENFINEMDKENTDEE